jgi:hypothetical protein
MHFRFGINRWKAIQALVWAVFSMAWAAVGTSVALHFHLENSWLGHRNLRRSNDFFIFFFYQLSSSSFQN